MMQCMWVADGRAKEIDEANTREGGEMSRNSQDESSIVFLLPIKQIL